MIVIDMHMVVPRIGFWVKRQNFSIPATPCTTNSGIIFNVRYLYLDTGRRGEEEWLQNNKTLTTNANQRPNNHHSTSSMKRRTNVLNSRFYFLSRLSTLTYNLKPGRHRIAQYYSPYHHNQQTKRANDDCL